VALKDGTEFQVSLANVYKPSTTTAIFDFTEANTQNTAKAYFNLLFVNNDRAKGVHNPKFAGQVLDNATAALGTVVIP
jgi:hypothetical protein